MKIQRDFWLILAAFSPAVTWALYESPAVGPEISNIPHLVFILDPGHGGEDMGAVIKGRKEKDLVLAIAKKVKDRLQTLGAGEVRLTRDSDVFLGLDERVGQSIQWGNPAAFVSLHLNQVRHKESSGITVFAFGKDRFHVFGKKHDRQVASLSPPPESQARASADLARSLARSLRAQGFRVNPIELAGFYVLKNPLTPSVLLELGYLSNPEEAALLADPDYQDRLAEAIAVSLHSHFAGLPSAVATAP